jgi:hypothetical protein
VFGCLVGLIKPDLARIRPFNIQDIRVDFAAEVDIIANRYNMVYCINYELAMAAHGYLQNSHAVHGVRLGVKVDGCHSSAWRCITTSH